MTGSDDGSLRRVLLLGLAVAVLLGAAAAGGSIVRSTSTEATARQAFPYALMGAFAAATVAAIVVVAVRSARPGSLRLRPAELLATVFIAAALGALVGAALTPRSPGPDEVSPLDDESIDERRRESGQFNEQTRAGPIDRDGDGLPDTDRDGNVIIAYDLDGDGVLDGFLGSCPDLAPEPAIEPRPGYTPIDVECDGIIDQWLPFDATSFLDGDRFLDAPPGTISPEERQQRADESGADGRRGDTLRTVLLILLAVAIAAAIIVWLVRMPDRARDGDDRDDGDDDDGGEDAVEGLGAPSVDLSAPFESSLDAMLDDPDPRRAICAAYGRLLDGFADAGLPRRTEEAPEEHVRRCLAAAHMDPLPVHELLELFAVARFSTHPVDESHRLAAVGAMRSALVSTGFTGVPVAAGHAGSSPPGAST